MFKLKNHLNSNTLLLIINYYCIFAKREGLHILFRAGSHIYHRFQLKDIDSNEQIMLNINSFNRRIQCVS
jgi:hypothetical protein